VPPGERGDAVPVEGAPPPAEWPALDALPEVRAALEPRAIVARLDTLARRGKLAGFAPSQQNGVLFEAACFGEPFDRVLEARAAGEGDRTVLKFSARLLPRIPAIFAVVTALTIWPGVWLTDSMLTTYFSWYKIPTWWWYMPLTIIPMFWMVPKMIRKSERSCRESAARQIAAIDAALNGR